MTFAERKAALQERDPTERRLDLVREMLKGAPLATKYDVIMEWATGVTTLPDGREVKGEPFITLAEAKTLFDELAP